MANHRLFRQDIPAACSYCLYGKDSSDGAMVECRRNGLVAPHFKCTRFKYNPVRRNPMLVQREPDEVIAGVQIS